MSEVELKVSIGEAIDKITILDIKVSKIKDERKNDVLVEYNYLYNKLKEQIKIFKFHYDLLLDVNTKIWDLQDEIRTNHDNFISKCENVLFLNDARFILKNKINTLSNSKFREQKGYTKRKVLIICENENLQKALYYSIFYDETYMYGQNLNFEEIRKVDPTIFIINDLNESEFTEIINLTIKSYKITHPYLLRCLS